MEQSERLHKFIESRRQGKTKKSQIISVDFTKKSGELRKIRFNPCELTGFAVNPTQGAIEGNKKRKANYPELIRVRDIDLPSDSRWRSINCKTITRIAADGEVFEFSK